MGTPPVPAAEIHRYAGTYVTTAAVASGGTAVASGELPLDIAVVQLLNTRFGTTYVPYSEALAAVELLIADPRTREAVRIGSGHSGSTHLDIETRHNFSLVYTLLKGSPEKLALWLKAYESENLNAYGQDKESCGKGMKERVITCLRGVTDSSDPITALFSQVEEREYKERQLKGFKAELNIGEEKNLPKIVSELEKRGITPSSDAAAAFSAYITSTLESWGQAALEVSELGLLTELMKDNFDSMIKPRLGKK